MSRRGVYRGMYSALFDDPDYQRLSPPARLVLLTLRLCAQAGVAAIFRVYPAVLAEQTGLAGLEVEEALVELARTPTPEAPWIFREAAIVWVRNGLTYDPNIRLADDKHRKGVERAISALPRLAIVASFCRYYEIASPFHDMPKGSGRHGEDHSPPRPSTEVVPETEVKPEAECRSGGSRETLNGTHAPSRLPREVQL